MKVSIYKTIYNEYIVDFNGFDDEYVSFETLDDAIRYVNSNPYITGYDMEV